MNKSLPLLLSALLLSAVAFAQVDFDRSINLTGTAGNAKVSGIKQVSAAQDAVSAEVLQKGSLVYAASTNTGNAYSVTLAPAVTAYSAGLVVNFRASAANTGAATINVNGLGAQAIKKAASTDLASNDILANQVVSLIYDGTNFQLIAGTTTADNGLSISSGNNVRLGGTLAASTSVALGGNNLSFTGSGNVGIGTTPFTTFQVNGRSQFGTTTQSSFIDPSVVIQIMSAGNTSASLGFWQSGIASGLIGTLANDQNFYLTNNYDGLGLGVAAKSITIDRNGNIGIGTTAPGARLTIKGATATATAAAEINYHITRSGTHTATGSATRLIRLPAAIGTLRIINRIPAGTSYTTAEYRVINGGWNYPNQITLTLVDSQARGGGVSGFSVTVADGGGGNLDINFTSQNGSWVYWSFDGLVEHLATSEF